MTNQNFFITILQEFKMVSKVLSYFYLFMIFFFKKIGVQITKLVILKGVNFREPHREPILSELMYLSRMSQ